MRPEPCHEPCRKPLNRRYIVVEGIYANTGMLAPLDAIVPLKHKCGHTIFKVIRITQGPTW